MLLTELFDSESFRPGRRAEPLEAARQRHVLQRMDWAVGLWLAFAAALTIKGILSPAVHSNFPTYQWGGSRWWEGLSSYLYDPSLDYDYRYGPVFTAAIMPLALLPVWVGGLLFSWFNLAAFLWIARALTRRLLPQVDNASRRELYVLLLLPAGSRMIWANQVNPLLIALMAAAAIAAVERRWWLASVLLAISVHIKVYPLAFALLLAACWPRQLSWRLAVSLCLVGLFPFLTKPPAYVASQYWEWLQVLVGRAQMRHQYCDFWTIWETVRTPVWPAGYRAIQLATAAAALGFCVWRKRRGASDTTLAIAALSLAAAWLMLFGPATERNTFGMIAPLTCWAAVLAFAQRRARLVASFIVLLTIVLANGVVERALVGVIPAVRCSHPLGVLLFAGWVVWWSLQDPPDKKIPRDRWRPPAQAPPPVCLGSRSRRGVVHFSADRPSRTQPPKTENTAPPPSLPAP